MSHNIPQIIEGHFYKALSKTPLANTEVETLADMRMKICVACTKDDKPCLNEANRCCRCNCDMEAKTRAINSKCPLGKW